MSKGERETILFYVQYRGTEHEVKTYTHEYRNLMALLYDKFYFENFGECKGIGRCGTCHVKVSAPCDLPMHRIGNEVATLGKMENTDESSRLSCHIQITKSLQQVRLRIADDGDLGLY